MQLTPNALIVLKRRYLKEGESPEGLCLRVAKAVAKNKEDCNRYVDLMTSLKFLPNSPTLMNAGVPGGQLAGCFVVPIEDNMESIFDALKAAALIHKSGGGTGFSFSKLRAKGSKVRSTNGVASGPVSFMRIFNTATEQVKQGGTRRGANMGVLHCDHPDIEEFVICKDDGVSFQNFNLSVSVTDNFMARLSADASHDMDVTRIWESIVDRAWMHGDPGLLFIDTINWNQPFDEQIEATNPCGEVPLLPYEACVLGSINLTKFVADKQILWGDLAAAVHTAVHFLNDVIDVCEYPLPQIKQIVLKNRKIGLGVMGFTDMLIQLGISYASNEALLLAENIMEYVNKCAHDLEKLHNYGNATLTTIAPTGTLSIIAGCSSGIEPIFAFHITKNVMDEDHLSEDYPGYEAHKNDVDDEGNKIYITAHEVSPEQHVRMQAAFQNHTDNAVSKTVNLPHDATREDVDKVFKLAYTLGCKGVTVYRDGSHANQVLTESNAFKKGYGEKVGRETRVQWEIPKDQIVPPPISHAVTERTLPISVNRPEVLQGQTFKIQTGLGNLYVTVNENEEVPVEVFCTIGKSGKSIMAKTEAIGRLVSLALRNQIPVKNIVKQLKGISGDKPIMTKDGMVWSIPDALGSLLEKLYVNKGEIAPVPLLKEECPDCGASLVHEEGCLKCTWCGYSKC